MAGKTSRPLSIGVFALGFWAATILPAVAAHVFELGRPIARAELDLAIEITALTSVAAAFGFAFVRGATAARAALAVPLALVLLYLVPSRGTIWLSESFGSVTVNIVAAGITFALVGFAAGWFAVKCVVLWMTRHA